MIKEKIVNFTLQDRLCVICIDEMSLKANLYYNISRDEVIGFQDLGHEKKFLPACNAAVIMIRGICKSWKQPVAYYLLNSTFNEADVQNVVQEVIRKLQNIGLKIVALVTDMGKNYQNMIKRLGVTLEVPYFEINGERIHYLADPPHLIKATRNNIYINNIKYNSDSIFWNHIATHYNYDKDQPNRLAYKLTDIYVQPSGFDRMKVKYAVHVLSATVAAALKTLYVINILPAVVLTTVEFIEKFDSLFDIFNSSTVIDKKSYRKAFTGAQHQLQFLQEMFDYLSGLKVFSKKKKKYYKYGSSFQVLEIKHKISTISVDLYANYSARY